MDAIGDLRVHLLLHLQAARIGVHHAGELGNADDLPVRQIADMGAADDRRKMMLAMRLKADIAQHDHLVIAFDLFEGTLKENDRIVGIAGKPILIGPRHPRRRIAQAFAVRIIARPAQQRSHGRFCLFSGGSRLPRSRRVDRGKKAGIHAEAPMWRLYCN